MSAGDVQFVGWTGGDPLYKELRPAIEYEPIRQGGVTDEENVDIEKRVTRNLLCFEKDRDSVLSQLIKSGENLKSVYIDTDGSAKELDFGPQWELLSVSESQQATGFIRISAQYKKQVSKALETEKPLGFNVHYPSKGIIQFRYRENVLEEFNTDYFNIKFNRNVKSPENYIELKRLGQIIERATFRAFETYLIVSDNIDKNEEHAFGQILVTNEFGQQVELERFSVSYQDIINYNNSIDSRLIIGNLNISRKVIHLDSVEIINSSTESTLGIVSGSKDKYIGIPNNVSFLYLEREEKNNMASGFTALGLNFSYHEALEYAKNQLLPEDDVKLLIDEWNSLEDGNYAVHEKSAGVARRSIPVLPGQISRYENAPFWVEAIYKYKKNKDVVDLSSRQFKINWTRDNNIIRLNFGPFTWKEYDVTGLT